MYTELRKGSKKEVCPSCGRRSFVPYVWTAEGAEIVGVQTGAIIDGVHGRCDHESSCGYFCKFSWNDVRAMLGNTTTTTVPRPRPTTTQPFTPHGWVDGNLICEMQVRRRATRSKALFTPLWQAMVAKERQSGEMYLDAGRYIDVMNAYRVGVRADGAISFPRCYIDGNGQCICHSVKYMHYNGIHRDKQKGNAFDFEKGVHGVATPDDYKALSVLFGLHVAQLCNGLPVGVVESEKTAIICAAAYPELAWVACGGLSMLTAERLRPLAGRDIYLFADADGASRWAERVVRELQDYRVTLKSWAHLLTAEQRQRAITNKCDIGDYLCGEV